MTTEITGYEIKPYAKLRDAKLRDADLRGADLRGADLRNADLRNADLCNADLRGADLCNADLCNADLRGAKLRGADLRGADLCNADLCNADLRDAEMDAFQIPQTGPLTVFKKLRNGVIATMLIPDDVARTATPVGRKCRAASAVVLALSKSVDVAYSIHDATFTYRIGDTVTPDMYNSDWRIECSNGIHFFLTLEEAQVYWL